VTLAMVPALTVAAIALIWLLLDREGQLARSGSGEG